jgi:hypothetical protein
MSTFALVFHRNVANAHLARRTAENVSAAARNAISLLEGLFAAEEEIANAPVVEGSGKRKRDSSGVKDVADPFQKVVNRLLVSSRPVSVLNRARR